MSKVKNVLLFSYFVIYFSILVKNLPKLPRFTVCMDDYIREIHLNKIAVDGMQPNSIGFTH